MAKEHKKVLFIAQELAPYVSHSEIAVKTRSIAEGILEKGYEVRTFMPKYSCINERRNQLHEVIRLSGINIVIDDTDHPLIIKVATLQPLRMQVYFIDNDDYFPPCTTKDLELRFSSEDNDERMMFFVRGVIETVNKLRWEPAVVHCDGWISSLVPLHLRRLYTDDPTFASSKIVVSIPDEKFEGSLDSRFVEKLKMSGFTDEDLQPLEGESVGYIDLMKLAIRYADAVVVNVPDPDAELIEYACANGKPVLDYVSAEELVPQITEFYSTLLQ